MTERSGSAPVANAGSGEREEVLALFRTFVADQRTFIEQFFKIQSRDIERVPFKLNAVQQDYWMSRTTRDIYLKARQVTVSSIIQADFTAQAMLFPGLNVLFLVQKPEQKTMKAHRDRVATFISSVPERFRPPIVTDNDHEVTFNVGGMGRSHLYFASAGSEAIGRGETLHRVHITEFASWEDDEANAVLDMLLGLPAQSRVCIESSPHGASGPLFQMWRSAKRGEGMYAPHLYEWWWQSEYRRDERELGPKLQLTEAESRLMTQHKLTLQQVAWRRSMIRQAESRWGEDAEQHFRQEYLEDDTTCFLLSGAPVFDVTFLARLFTESRNPARNEAYGLRVWLEPEPGEIYVIGADPAEGLASSNLSAAIVRKARTWEHVATLRGQIPPAEFAGRLSELASAYNNALINPERNNHGHSVIMALQDVYRYPRIYCHLQQIAIGGDDGLGFPTNQLTKPAIVSQQADMVRQRLWGSWDRELLDQMRIYEETEGKYGADEDDLVSADLMALAARNQALAQRGFSQRAPASHGGKRWS